MTPRTWAEEMVAKAVTGYQWNGRIRKSTVILPAIAAKLLQAEHARAVRIVKRHIKHMAGATPYQWEKGYQAACNNILAALQRGRTRGK